MAIDHDQLSKQLETAEQTQFAELVQVDETYAEVKKMVTAYEKAGIRNGMGCERQ